MEFKDKIMLYCFRELKCKQGFTTGTSYYLYSALGLTVNILLFFSFGVNHVHCFGLKPGVRGEHLMCFVSAKIKVLGRRLKCQQCDTS